MAEHKNIYLMILEDLEDQVEFLDTYVYYFEEYLSKCNLQESQETLKEEYVLLDEKLNELYAYDLLEQKNYSVKQIYLLGALWGALGLFSAIEEKKQDHIVRTGGESNEASNKNRSI